MCYEAVHQYEACGHNEGPMLIRCQAAHQQRLPHCPEAMNPATRQPPQFVKYDGPCHRCEGAQEQELQQDSEEDESEDDSDEESTVISRQAGRSRRTQRETLSDAPPPRYGPAPSMQYQRPGFAPQPAQEIPHQVPVGLESMQAPQDQHQQRWAFQDDEDDGQTVTELRSVTASSRASTARTARPTRAPSPSTSTVVGRRYGALPQGDEAQHLDDAALKAGMEASLRTYDEGAEYQDTVSATRQEAAEYERRMMEQVLQLSLDDLPTTRLWHEQNEFLKQRHRMMGESDAGYGDPEQDALRAAQRNSFATRMDEYKHQAQSRVGADNRRKGRTQVPTSEAGKSKSTRLSQRPPSEWQAGPRVWEVQSGTPSSRMPASSSRPQPTAPEGAWDFAAVHNIPRQIPSLAQSRQTGPRSSVSTRQAPKDGMRGPGRPSTPPLPVHESRGYFDEEERRRRELFERRSKGHSMGDSDSEEEADEDEEDY